MCGLAKRVGARILLASTSEVYGDPDVHPQVEEYFGNVNCIGTRSCYDEGKRAAETLLMDYHRQHNVDIRIIRIFNTYGPRMLFNDGRVVSNFVVQSLRNDPVTVYGDGSQSRSFCYVSDLVEGIYRMMNQTGTNGPVNLGNPGEYTMKQLAEKVIEFNKESQSKLEYRTLPKDDPRRRKPDISKAKSYLNWEPTIPLDEGLRKTIDDFAGRAKKNPKELVCSHQKEALKIEQGKAEGA